MARAPARAEVVAGVRVENADRVVYPAAGFTKGDVVEYYARIAPLLLAHLAERPVTLKRYPDEAGGQFFYEKDAPAFTPKWVRTFPVWRRSGESQIRYIVIENERTLVWAAGVGTLEIHPFLARVPDIEQPTEIVFDLDPGERADILRCGEVAFLLRELLERLSLKSFVKVSGSKGLQVYVPLNTPATYAVTQPFARTVAGLLAQQQPKLVVAEMRKEERKNRVFIDWSQNADYKTTVSVYSLRAKRRHPYISLPVSWEELQRAMSAKDSESLFFSPAAALERVAKIGDLFRPVLELRQRLPESFTHELHIPAPAKKTPQRPQRARIIEMPRASAQGGRRRFLVRHRSSDPAYELLMEIGDLTTSWTLPEGFPAHTRERCPAVPRPVSQEMINFDRMARSEALWDTGNSELVEGNYKKGYLHLHFSGERLKGDRIFRRELAAEEWFVAKYSDEVARFPLENPTKPVRRARARPGKQQSQPEAKPLRLPVSIDTLRRAAVRFIAPMECRLVHTVPAGDEWLYELKLDGFRAIAVKEQSRVTLYSRHGNPLDARFPLVSAALRHSAISPAVLDGEIVALDAEGRPSFQELQNSRTSRAPIVYYVFDVLQYNGGDLHDLPLNERKAVLEAIAPGLVEPVRMAAVLDTDPKSLLGEIKRLGLEGVVAKRRNSRYESGKRSGAWVKYRINERETFVIGGYIPWKSTFDALLVGRPEGKRVMFIKKLRNGFVPRTRSEVFAAIEDLRTPECPFVNLPEPSDRRGAVDADEMKRCVWVEPKVKCEVEFEEWTEGGRLRHAAFRQLVNQA